MPISKYFNNHGSEVMSNMSKTYGPEKAKSVFYATANKQEATPKNVKPAAKRDLMSGARRVLSGRGKV